MWAVESAESLISQLNSLDETDTIEAKLGSDIGRAAWETISAFSNEPELGGGHIIFGLRPIVQTLFSPVYEIVGVPDPGKLQTELATQCAELFNIPIRPRISPEVLGEKVVVVAFIPEVAATDKPVYIKKDGLPRGAFRRMGGTDHHCTEEDLVALFHARNIKTFDSEVIDDATMLDIDSKALLEYRRLRAHEKADATELMVSDEELLTALGCASVKKGELRPTIAGLLLFGAKQALKRYFPTTRVDYIRVPGKEWVSDPDSRYHTVRIHKPIIASIFSARDTMLDDIPKGFNIGTDGFQRSDEPLIPSRVIREAIVNALIHRCYRSRSPVQIIRYANRIEIINPGYSLKAAERLKEPGTNPRNPQVADAIRNVGLAETMGLGVKLMSDKMKQIGLEAPHIESDRAGNRFIIRLLFHHFLSDEDCEWLSQFKELSLNGDDLRALIFVREVGAIDNSTYRGFGDADTLTASHRLKNLCEAGLLEKRGGGSRTYYLPTERLLNPVGSKKNPTGNGKNPQDKAVVLTTRYEAQEDWEKSEEPEPLPKPLQALIDALPRRSGHRRMARAILSLCAWRDLKSNEIAWYCERNATYLRDSHISRLLEDKLLGLTDHPSSPNLRYRTTEAGKTWLKRASRTRE